MCDEWCDLSWSLAKHDVFSLWKDPNEALQHGLGVGAMAMFTPPAPKTLPPMPVVAPYVSDADTRKKLWELGMRHHLKALEGLGAKGKAWIQYNWYDLMMLDQWGEEPSRTESLFSMV